MPVEWIGIGGEEFLEKVRGVGIRG